MSIFNNIKIAFQDKSIQDLNRAYLLFKVINNPTATKILTSLLSLAMYLRLPINAIIKATVYKHFCGGTTIDNSQKTINNLWKYNIGTILNFSAEGQKNEIAFTRAMNETISSIKKAKDQESIPFAVFKPTSLVRFALLQKINTNIPLSNKEVEEKVNFKNKVEKICDYAKQSKVPLFIDAEESWIQNAIDEIAKEMMRKFNTNRAWIYNTLQMYRIDRNEYLNLLIKDSIDKNYFIGIKIVRGAYHEQEIFRAEKNNYNCPVYRNKEDTDNAFNKALNTAIKNIDKIFICAGTHNEESSELLIKLMKKHNIANNDKRIYFSQLLGMSDHISYNGAKEGYNIAKYVPYGPLRELLPYLIRRAEENTSISGQMGRELVNIQLERKRRKN